MTAAVFGAAGLIKPLKVSLKVQCQWKILVLNEPTQSCSQFVFINMLTEMIMGVKNRAGMIICSNFPMICLNRIITAICIENEQ